MRVLAHVIRQRWIINFWPRPDKLHFCIVGSNNGMLLHGANLAYGNTSANISITTIPTTVLAPNVEADPLPLRPDFAPAKESPAYGAALASPLAVDFHGRPRPLNLRAEIGAVENDQTWGTVLLLR